MGQSVKFVSRGDSSWDSSHPSPRVLFLTASVCSIGSYLGWETTTVEGDNFFFSGHTSPPWCTGCPAVGSVSLSTMGQEGPIGVFGTVEGSVAQFRFVDNTMSLTAMGPLRERFTVFDDVYVVFLTLSVSSATPSAPLVVLANNTATWTGNADTRGKTGAVFAYLVITGAPHPGEMIHLVNNTMSTADFVPVHGLYLEMPPTPSSAVVVLNSNHLAPGVGTPSWSALVLNTSSVDVAACGNTIESRVCGGRCDGSNPCIAYNRSRVRDCHTATCTASLTPTSSVHHTASYTLSSSHHTITPSLSTIPSSTPSQSQNTYSSSRSAPQAATPSAPLYPQPKPTPEHITRLLPPRQGRRLAVKSAVPPLWSLPTTTG